MMPLSFLALYHGRCGHPCYITNVHSNTTDQNTGVVRFMAHYLDILAIAQKQILITS